MPRFSVCLYQEKDDFESPSTNAANRPGGVCDCSSLSYARLSSYAIHISRHTGVIIRIVHEKGVMSVPCLNLDVAYVEQIIGQRFDDLARARGRKTTVGGKCNHQIAGLCLGERRHQTPAIVARRGEVIERLGDAQVSIGIERLRKLIALVAQIGLDFEIHLKIEVEGAGSQSAAELLHHRIIGQIGDMPKHSREPQSARRHYSMGVVITAMEVWIGRDGLTRYLVEGDVLRRQSRRGGDH